MSKNSVIITGADGFIGSHLVKYFSENEIIVYAIIIKNSPLKNRIEGIDNVIILEEDLQNWGQLVSLLPKESMAFFHLAWAGVSPDARKSIETQLINIELCMNAVRLAHAVKTQKFILPGSTSEYTDCGHEINETSCPSPANAYGAAKVALRYLCELFCEELMVPYIYVVITGIYAADRVDNNVIYYAITSLLSGKKTQFTKLEQKWDYVHIDDVMLALFLIGKQGKAGQFYVVGHGDNWPLYNYIYQIRDIINPELPLGIGEIPYKNDKMPSSCVDLTNLYKDTGFIPKVTFSDGIKEVIDTIAKNLEKEAK